MPVTYVVDKPSPVGYIQWTGDNVDEFSDYLGSMFSVQALENGNLRLSAAQNPGLTRDFTQGTWIAGINNYMSNEQKLSRKQEVPGPNVEYLTQETP